MVSADGGECVPTDVGGEHTENCPNSEVMSTSEGGCPEDDDVLGGTIGDDDDVLGGTTGDDDVAGSGAGPDERSETDAAPAGAALPFTGAALIGFLIAGLALIGAGIAAIRRGK